MSTARRTKKLSFTCEQCRKRKVKCDGAQTGCNRCRARGTECEYKQSPTLVYTHRLEQRVRDLEGEVSSLRGQLSQVQDNPTRANNAHEDAAAEVWRDFPGLEIDDKGLTTYHGSTSFFHLLGIGGHEPQHLDKSLRTLQPGFQTGDEGSLSLVMNAWLQRAQENLTQTPEPFQYLLNFHWCWVQPLFNFIYRPAFTRDMAAMGPYYSHTLMNALLSHSIRWGRSDLTTRELLRPYDDGAVFGRHARTMIFNELSQGICTIPTIQTLLLLSAQECSFGNSAQAWVYSGIAFRLIDHLGIHFDGQRYAGSASLTDEDIEIRRRLFWSCYFWDKLISLYLGRSPSLQQSSISPPQRILDDSAEDELWEPYGMKYANGEQYPPAPSHSISSFMQMCKLSVIFNQILIHMYDPTQRNSEREIQNCFVLEEASLNRWWQELPPSLKIETNSLPSLAPPSHIVTMNCLYHTFRILLYRPMLSRRLEKSPNAAFESRPAHLVECVSSATSIMAIFDMFCHTFDERFCTLSLAYSVYIASSIFLLQVQATRNNIQALRRLEYCVHALVRASKINSVISSVVSLITEAVSKLGLQMGEPPLFQPLCETDSEGMTIPAPTAEFGSLPFQEMSGDTTYSSRFFDNIDLDGLDISPELFEAVANLEPLSVRVASVDEHAP